MGVKLSSGNVKQLKKEAHAMVNYSYRQEVFGQKNLQFDV